MSTAGDARDRELVAAANAGDARAFEELYARHAEWVLRLALRLTGRREDAHDVVQEAFLYLLRKFPGFELTSRLTTLLYPTVHHLALEARRRAGRFASDAEALAAAAGETREVVEPGPLLAALARLSDAQREVVLLRFSHGLGVADVAVALGIPEGTVKSRTHQALGLLRADARLAEYFED